MKKKEVLNELSELKQDMVLEEPVAVSMVPYRKARKIIDDIFIDIESRVCKNCKFYDKEDFLCNVITESDSWIQDVLDRTVPNAQFCPDEDFGCNKFERISNE